jgi:ABC-type thiamin/hydroxymethylpyrimidine transport system permease subunit
LNSSTSNHSFTHDIVTVAILASLGGALSTFVGYLGNLINLALGVPFGAGQFMAGIHVFWLVLIRALVPRSGNGALGFLAGTIGGTLKGLVEFFTGSTHGIVIILISLTQGILIDFTSEIAGDYQSGGATSRLTWWIGAGLSSAFNVIIFQIFYFSGVPFLYIAIITLLAFCSGIIFAGYFAWETVDFLTETGIILSSPLDQSISTKSKTTMAKQNIPAIAFLLFLIVGSTYYVVGVANFSSDLHSCQITGLVEQPYMFRVSDFTSNLTTIEAQLSGSYVELPRANYTGIRLSIILQYAVTLPGASNVRISARDGYMISLNLDSVMSDSDMILTDTQDGLWLISGNYVGSYWVQMVSTIEVY